MAKETKPNIKKDQATVEQTDDLLPKEGEWWRAVKDAGKSIAELHDFYPIQTSPLEQVSSMKICQGVCDEDVEGYGTIKTRKGKMVLRTSWPKAIVRSCIENRLLYFSSPLKVSFCGPVFTGIGEKNFREEWGVEIIGDNDAIYDGYIIMAVVEFLKLVKIKNITLKINSKINWLNCIMSKLS
jgi:histidyl-tRNA synthetase